MGGSQSFPPPDPIRVIDPPGDIDPLSWDIGQTSVVAAIVFVVLVVISKILAEKISPRSFNHDGSCGDTTVLRLFGLFAILGAGAFCIGWGIVLRDYGQPRKLLEDDTWPLFHVILATVITSTFCFLTLLKRSRGRSFILTFFAILPIFSMVQVGIAVFSLILRYDEYRNCPVGAAYCDGLFYSFSFTSTGGIFWLVSTVSMVLGCMHSSLLRQGGDLPDDKDPDPFYL